MFCSGYFTIIKQILPCSVWVITLFYFIVLFLCFIICSSLFSEPVESKPEKMPKNEYLCFSAALERYISNIVWIKQCFSGIVDNVVTKRLRHNALGLKLML